MMEKGLFNSLFVLIMLAMFVPSLSLITKTQNVMDTKYQIEEIAFTSDSIIADAISDRTFFNECLLDSNINYNDTVDTYLKNFEISKKKYSSIDCNFTNITTTVVGSATQADYSGSLDIICNSKNEITDVTIKKIIYFDKEINATLGADCSVIIVDNLNSGNIQVSLNK